jgi:predicted neutral ceramidase superfamily lipid hydrolase
VKAKLYILKAIDPKTNRIKQMNQLVIEDGDTMVGIMLGEADMFITASENPKMFDDFLASRELIGELDLPDDLLVKARNFIKANDELQKYHSTLLAQKLL